MGSSSLLADLNLNNWTAETWAALAGFSTVVITQLTAMAVGIIRATRTAEELQSSVQVASNQAKVAATVSKTSDEKIDQLLRDSKSTSDGLIGLSARVDHIGRRMDIFEGKLVAHGLIHEELKRAQAEQMEARRRLEAGLAERRVSWRDKEAAAEAEAEKARSRSE